MSDKIIAPYLDLSVVGRHVFPESKCLRDEEILQTLPVGTTASFYFSDLGAQLTWGTVSTVLRSHYNQFACKYLLDPQYVQAEKILRIISKSLWLAHLLVWLPSGYAEHTVTSLAKRVL